MGQIRFNNQYIMLPFLSTTLPLDSSCRISFVRCEKTTFINIVVLWTDTLFCPQKVPGKWAPTVCFLPVQYGVPREMEMAPHLYFLEYVCVRILSLRKTSRKFIIRNPSETSRNAGGKCNVVTP